MAIDKRTILETGGTITGVCGFAADVYPKLVGKVIALSSDNWRFNYLMTVTGVLKKTYGYTLEGVFSHATESLNGDCGTHTAGKQAVVSVWIIDNFKVR